MASKWQGNKDGLPPRRHRPLQKRLTLRQVSKRAALTSKRMIWDSNDASIDVAQSAVDHWEATYNALRGLLVASVHSAHGLYGAAKAGANGLEHGLLLPVKDWILLPAFGGMESIVTGTGRFLQSPEAAHLAESSLGLVKQVPVIGDNFLAPALVISVEIIQKAWKIVQYPIPSKDVVRDSVDAMLTATKWALSTAGREIYFYTKRMDANITRTLMHTQWKVLGSGPYATLDKLHKIEVLDHICERYLSITEIVERYELIGHIRIHNRQLYRDLVLSGLLRERGGEVTKEDEWLSSNPSYRSLEPAFLIHTNEVDVENDIKAVYFRLPYQNGKKPGKDVPWVRFTEGERIVLEANYLKKISTNSDDSLSTSAIEGSHPPVGNECQKFPTIAQWYSPNNDDVLVDQKRHAISFLPACARCRHWFGEVKTPLALKKNGDLCVECLPFSSEEEVYHLPPATAMIMRPTFWRFHGQGDDVCRSVWFLDTQRHGLQPYSEESAAILEDAYLFLKWQNGNGMRKVDIDGVLLTVQVASPDGSEQQLIQFSSLTQATAIQKTLGGAFSIFKRRVYRGLRFQRKESKERSTCTLSDHDLTVDSSPFHNANCDTIVSDESDWELLETDSEERDGLRSSVQVTAVRSMASEMLAYPETKIVDESKCFEQTHHLVLIVHGIGEMLRSVDVMGMSLPSLSSIIDCCGYLRKNHNEVQSNQESLASMSGRVEYLPCEWHEAFALQSQRQPTFDLAPEKRSGKLGATLNDISLKTIPNMREFANDQLMDVLYFMSQQHHDVIIEIVATEMNVVVRKFRQLTGFCGQVSIIGHSLGSIVTWDLLANQLHPHCDQDGFHDERETFSPPSENSRDASSSSPGHPKGRLLRHEYSEDKSQSFIPICLEGLPARTEEFQDDEQETRPSAATFDRLVHQHSMKHDSTLLSPPYSGTTHNEGLVDLRSSGCNSPKLEFEVEIAFMLGSPIPVFLMIRNQQEPLCQDFVLPGCRRVFNIFHPFDPVAYRMEPLIDPRNADIEPKIISHWNGGYRVQYQTKRLWKRIVIETKKTQESVMDVVEAQMSRLGLLDTLSEEEDEAMETLSEDVPLDPICGSLNEGRRIDYMIQEKEIENANEYVAALAAHSSYWTEKDLSLFVARQIVRSTLESAWIDTTKSSNFESDIDF